MDIRRIAAAIAAAALLTSCSSTRAGAAAVIDGREISAATVGNRVNEVRSEIQQLPAGSVTSVPAVVDLNVMVVNQILLHIVLEKTAAKHNVTVSDADVATFRDGVFAQCGEGTIRLQLKTQNAVSDEYLDEFMRAVLLENRIGVKLLPDGSSDEQTAALVKGLGAVSTAMGVSVSPRFGEWNPNKVQIMQGDNLLSLVAPATA